VHHEPNRYVEEVLMFGIDARALKRFCDMMLWVCARERRRRDEGAGVRGATLDYDDASSEVLME
jgi:hypothetical protein